MRGYLKQKAFAFGVIAYGDREDLACSLLYIPDLDTSPEKRARMGAIRAWMKEDKGPTNAEVKKVFPQFVAPKP